MSYNFLGHFAKLSGPCIIKTRRGCKYTKDYSTSKALLERTVKTMN